MGVYNKNLQEISTLLDTKSSFLGTFLKTIPTTPKISLIATSYLALHIIDYVLCTMYHIWTIFQNKEKDIEKGTKMKEQQKL